MVTFTATVKKIGDKWKNEDGVGVFFRQSVHHEKPGKNEFCVSTVLPGSPWDGTFLEKGSRVVAVNGKPAGSQTSVASLQGLLATKWRKHVSTTITAETQPTHVHFVRVTIAKSKGAQTGLVLAGRANEVYIQKIADGPFLWQTRSRERANQYNNNRSTFNHLKNFGNPGRPNLNRDHGSDTSPSLQVGMQIVDVNGVSTWNLSLAQISDMMIEAKRLCLECGVKCSGEEPVRLLKDAFAFDPKATTRTTSGITVAKDTTGLCYVKTIAADSPFKRKLGQGYTIVDIGFYDGPPTCTTQLSPTEVMAKLNRAVNKTHAGPPMTMTYLETIPKADRFAGLFLFSVRSLAWENLTAISKTKQKGQHEFDIKLELDTLHKDFLHGPASHILDKALQMKSIENILNQAAKTTGLADTLHTMPRDSRRSLYAMLGVVAEKINTEVLPFVNRELRPLHFHAVCGSFDHGVDPFVNLAAEAAKVADGVLTIAG